MKIAQSGVTYSAIVGINEKLKNLSKKTGEQYLFLNRGVNAVCNINLSDVINDIDFNSSDIQVYPLNRGKIILRDAINKVYFGDKTSSDNILVVPGASAGIDLAVQILDVDYYYLPEFYWGTYTKIMAMRNKQYKFYEDFDLLKQQTDKLKKAAVVICDPNNPIGNKVKDSELLELISILNKNGTIVIFDSPYRRVFYDDNDTFYQELLKFDNVVVIESFSKSVGLSGQRIGFIHSSNTELIEEGNVRLLFQTVGTNGFAQMLVYNLLTTDAGKKAVSDFKRETTKGIKQNIEYLQQKKLLVEEFYINSKPMGIFAVVNKTQNELLVANIGSVSLSYFTQTKAEIAQKYSRICVSVPHEIFTNFFDKL